MIHSIGTFLAKLLIAPIVFLMGVAGYAPVQETQLGATLPISGQTYTLAGSGVSAAATSITLSSLTLPQSGYEILDADLSSTFYITLEPGNRTKQEIVSCTTVTQNVNDTATLSGCSRGLLPISPYTASSTYAFPHGGGTSVIFSNPPQLYNQFAAKDNNEIITGIWSYPEPTTASSSATKNYVDSLAIGAGQVVGAASSTDSTVVRFDSTTGKVLKNSSLSLTETSVVGRPRVTLNPINTTATSTDFVINAGQSTATSTRGGAILIGGGPSFSDTQDGGWVQLTGGLAPSASTGRGGDVIIAGGCKLGAGSHGDIILYDSECSAYGGILDMSSIASSDKTFTFPNTTGTVALTSQIPTTFSINSGSTTKDISTTTATVIAHGLGATPALVRLTGVSLNAGNDLICNSNSVYTTSQSSNFVCGNIGAGTEEVVGTAFRFYGNLNTDKYITGVVTVDATNITITWSLQADPTGTANIIWEAHK